jgi:phage gpG-like protein
MTPKEFQQRLKSLKTEFKDLYDRKAGRIAGQVAVDLFKKNFQEEGFFGVAWKEVKRRRGEDMQEQARQRRAWSRGQARKRAWNRQSSNILTGSGDLGRSIKYRLPGDGTVEVFTDASAFGSKEPYGRVHNEGLRAGRGKGFKMPKRQFIGDHPELRKAIVSALERKLGELRVKS